MDNGIYFYNFPWDDYGTVSMSRMLDSVKVIDFALTEGKINNFRSIYLTIHSIVGKAAVHCHAGLGRTGTYIACYLIFAKQFSAVDAIMLVRKNRPRSIQTRSQLECIREFENFLRPLRVVFGEVPFADSKSYSQASLALDKRLGDDSLTRTSFDGVAALHNSASSSSLKALAQTAAESKVVIHREFTLTSYLRHQNSLFSGEDAR